MANSISSNNASSGVLTALGVGSGLDISSLVTSLTTAEMQASKSRLSRRQKEVSTQVSAIATLKSAVSTYQTALKSLLNGSSVGGRSVSSGDKSIFTATATNAAAMGSYQVRVTQLAQSQQLISRPFSNGANTAVGTGDLTISVGDKRFTLAIDSSNSTLGAIRNAINSASTNPGVTATLVYGSSGAQLILATTDTGAARTISVSTTDPESGLNQLAYSEDEDSNYTVQRAAQDAVVSIAGVMHTSATNTVSNVIDGLTLSLKATNPDTDVSLQISNDTDRVVGIARSLVSAYNALAAQLRTLGRYDADTKTPGAMLGDPLLATIKSQLQRALTDPVAGLSGPYVSLTTVGITHAVDGSLEFDASKLSAALSANYAAVAQVFDARSTGVTARLTSLLEKQLSSTGTITSRNQTLDSAKKSFEKDQAAIDLRTAQVRARYLRRFNAMDNYLGQMQSTSTYLTNVFNALNKNSR